MQDEQRFDDTRTEPVTSGRMLNGISDEDYYSAFGELLYSEPKTDSLHSQGF